MARRYRDRFADLRALRAAALDDVSIELQRLNQRRSSYMLAVQASQDALAQARAQIERCSGMNGFSAQALLLAHAYMGDQQQRHDELLERGRAEEAEREQVLSEALRCQRELEVIDELAARDREAFERDESAARQNEADDQWQALRAFAS